MQTHSVIQSLVFSVVATSFLAAQSTPSFLCPPQTTTNNAPGFTLAPTTGALAWTLPVGEVPGSIPVPVVFRFHASMTSDVTKVAGSRSLAQPVLRYRGIWSSLHFGFLAPAQELSPGLIEEGTQILENGTEFRDRDWTGRVADGSRLPVAFGFTAPAGGYATEATRTYGLFAATLRELGSWRAQVAQLTSASRFKVLMDSDLARVYAYQDTLKTFVPVLWVDRAGHWVSFRWQQSASFSAFTVRVTNPEAQGVQVSWAAHGASAGEVDLLRADFIGLPTPSLRVMGYPGLPDRLPTSLERPGAAFRVAVPLAVGGPVGRPTRIQWGAPGLDAPTGGPGLSGPSALPAELPREWTFTYADSSLAELDALRDPLGARTSFSFATYAFPDHAPLLRGVSEARTMYPSGAVRTQAWTRELPSAAGAAWTVSHHVSSTGAPIPEDRTTVCTFTDAGRSDGTAFLRSSQVWEVSGTISTATYDPSVPGPEGLNTHASAHFSGTVGPRIDVRWMFEPGTGRVLKENLDLDGVEVQSRTFTYGPLPDLGPDLPTAVTVTRLGLPDLHEVGLVATQSWNFGRMEAADTDSNPTAAFASGGVRSRNEVNTLISRGFIFPTILNQKSEADHSFDPHPPVIDDNHPIPHATVEVNDRMPPPIPTIPIGPSDPGRVGPPGRRGGGGSAPGQGNAQARQAEEEVCRAEKKAQMIEGRMSPEAKARSGPAYEQYKQDVHQAIDKWTIAGSLHGNLKAFWEAPSTRPPIIEATNWTTGAIQIVLLKMGFKGISLPVSNGLFAFSSIWAFMDNLTGLENHSIKINDVLKNDLDNAAKNYWKAVNGN